MTDKNLCIACGVFRSDLEAELRDRPRDLDIIYLPGGLHSQPAKLREELQNSIDENSHLYSQIIILFGLCGRGIVGLESQNASLVLPRAHDCISLFLGGIEEYRQQFNHAPGTYYISAGWYEEQIQPKGNARREVEFPKEYVDTRDPQLLRERFGAENAEEISGFFDSWKKNYSRAVYIDTGSADEKKYESYAKNLAAENDWEYVKLTGSRRLIRRCLEAQGSDDSVVFIPPGHQVIQDLGSGTVASAPVGTKGDLKKNTSFAVQRLTDSRDAPIRHYGLGIDAGGTYTDAAIFDFRTEQVLAKAKALTTKWKYSVGIMNAVAALPEELVDQVDLVSVSTTLVTNAIVESNRRTVGLLLMPNGKEIPPDLNHHPVSVIRGRMSIGGDIREDIDEAEIIRVVRKIVSQFHVEAFAVSGYGGSVNPVLEQAVKNIVRRETGMEVCCGHELSGTLNFSIRATTAVLNAGVMPIMEEFLEEMEAAVAAAGITAPMMMVRGDGSVMNESYAREFPVQTALSGPAASMAGARFLTGTPNAVVVDVGGTTSDIGFLEDHQVAVRDDGARIGEWDTHVSAVDMITAGLGGDSEFVFEKQHWHLGPRRVTPAGSLGEAVLRSVDGARRRIDEWGESTIPLQFLYRTGKEPSFELTSRERAVYEVLENGPLMIWEVQENAGIGSWRLVKPGRLETSYCVQRAGLTPTDFYHDEALISLWESSPSSAYISLIAQATGKSRASLRELLRRRVSDILGNRLLSGLLAGAQETALFRTILEGGNARLKIRPGLTIPVIGLGAPASLMLSDVMKRIGGNPVYPENGDVANAVGAVTSKVSITRQATIHATSAGGFRIAGFEGENAHFESLDEAEERCLQLLIDQTRNRGQQAGTSESGMTVEVRTETAKSAEGSELFIERSYTARLIGRPDLL